MIVENNIIDVSKLEKNEIEFLFDSCMDFLALFGDKYDLEDCKIEMDKLIEKCVIPFNEGLVQ